MVVKIIKDGQEIDIKNLDKDFLNNLLVTFLSQVGLKEDNELLKNPVEKEEDLFTKEDVNALQVIEEEIPVPHCTGDPTNCSLCNNAEELIVDFSGALDALKEGYRVIRKSWCGLDVSYLFLFKENDVTYSTFLLKDSKNEKVYPYTFQHDDLLAEDWLVISKDY